jgi:hypothetical protein
MNIQDKYKWNGVKLAGQLWARGLSQKVMDLHNDAVEALAIELDRQQGREDDDIWTEVIELEAFYRGLQKELNTIKKEMSELTI